MEIAEAWNLKSGKKCWPISFTNRWNGCLFMISAVLFWYFLISRRATVPGLNLKGTLILRAVGSFLTTFWRRDLAPLNLRAVCLVRAISSCLVSSLVLSWRKAELRSAAFFYTRDGKAPRSASAAIGAFWNPARWLAVPTQGIRSSSGLVFTRCRGEPRFLARCENTPFCGYVFLGPSEHSLNYRSDRFDINIRNHQ